MFCFCKHDWEVISEKVITKSYLPDIWKAGLYINETTKGLEARKTREETHILVLKCKKCSKVDKIITRS